MANLRLLKGMERLQDRGWSESICILIEMDKICLVCVCQSEPQAKGCRMAIELTSMPSVGMRVTIWKSRQKVKKMYPSIAK